MSDPDRDKSWLSLEEVALFLVKASCRGSLVKPLT